RPGRGRRALLAARAPDGSVVGTAMLERARPANARHRAEVQKVLVARRWRGQGVATRLLAEAERVARAEGVTLLVLDTGRAGRLYETAGYARAGDIPRYWRTNEGDLAPTHLYYKLL
ncbi:MAG TPA: GNAT family N-acetyltransferase, partial [Candidatus Thermoplasmatota archaeon]|nr:GNAT family N-acetyltransferase [Candidatus Thermoplasmatota archaeon]